MAVKGFRCEAFAVSRNLWRAVMPLRMVFTLALLVTVAACADGVPNGRLNYSGLAEYEGVYGIPEGYDTPGYGGPGATGEAPPAVNNLPYLTREMNQAMRP
jgi:hypothetical protein